MKAIGVEKFAVFEKVVEGYGWRHVVSDNFKDAPNQITFNHDDEGSVVLVCNIAQRNGRSNNLLFGVGDSHKRTFVSKFDDGSKLSVDQNVVQDSAGQYRRDEGRFYGVIFGHFIASKAEVDFDDYHETFEGFENSVGLIGTRRVMSTAS